MDRLPFFVSEKSIDRFYRFLEKIQTETYPETPLKIHTMISDDMIDKLFGNYLKYEKGAKILDVGCGQGLGLKKFKEYNLQATGITLNEEDYKITKELGYDVYQMDQSFLEFANCEFDFVWARHVLEHSIFPLFTLTEYSRVLKPDGILYVEVPAPETYFHHENNPNHYSVFTSSVWKSLFYKANYSLILEATLPIQNDSGDEDLYYVFLLKNKGNKTNE